MRAICAGFIFSLASSMVNHSALSISGKDCLRPLFGGHSISNVLLLICEGSIAVSTAQDNTCLPLFCLIAFNGMNLPEGFSPVSSSNSRLAAESGSSSSLYSPLMMVQAPASLFFQNGPPGCASSTSSCFLEKRKGRRPADFLDGTVGDFVGLQFTAFPHGTYSCCQKYGLVPVG